MRTFSRLCSFPVTNADKKVIDTSQKECSFNCYGHVQANCLESCNVIVNVPCAHRCDGDSDCPNGADEKNCSGMTFDSHFQLKKSIMCTVITYVRSW